MKPEKRERRLLNPAKGTKRRLRRTTILSRADYSSTSPHLASRRVTRAVTLIADAGRQLHSASRAAPNHFHRDRLHFIADGLRRLSLPLSRIASRLEKGGDEQ